MFIILISSLFSLVFLKGLYVKNKVYGQLLLFVIHGKHLIPKHLFSGLFLQN